MVKDHFKGASYNSCFAVFDGHGGQRAAEFARQRLSTMLELHSELETNVMGSITQGKSSLTVKVKQSTLLQKDMDYATANAAVLEAAAMNI